MSRQTRSRTDLRALIHKLDARCRAQVDGLVDDKIPHDSWPAVLFRIRSQFFLSPLEQLAEVLELPRDLTRIPGAKTWVIGVANNRGTLLPVFDLAALVQGTPLVASKRSQDLKQEPRRITRIRERVLVIKQEELPCGLAVSEAIGLRHVQLADQLHEIPDGLGVGKPYVTTSYRLDKILALEEDRGIKNTQAAKNALVPVLQLGRLIKDPLFAFALV